MVVAYTNGRAGMSNDAQLQHIQRTVTQLQQDARIAASEAHASGISEGMDVGFGLCIAAVMFSIWVRKLLRKVTPEEARRNQLAVLESDAVGVR